MIFLTKFILKTYAGLISSFNLTDVAKPKTRVKQSELGLKNMIKVTVCVR